MCSTSVATSSGPLLDVQVGLQVGALDRVPDLHGERRQLGGVEHVQPRVLVEQRLELRHLVVGVRAHHRRHEVVDDHGMHAALGLDALARVVDDERVDERHVAERRIGGALGRERERLARQPLERAVLAEVHDRVGAPDAIEPPVAGEVVMRGRQLGVVVDADRVVAVAPRRLDRHEHVAELEPGDHEVVAVDEAVARRRAPAALHRLAQRLGQLRVPGEVLRDRQPQRRGRELVVGQELGVVAARGDQRVHELVAVPRTACSTRMPSAANASNRRSALAGVSRPTAMPTLACLVGKLVSSTATRRLLGRQRAQPRGAHRQPRNPRAALEVGRVVRDGHADPRAGRRRAP